jgi:hypothetical protein
VDKLVTIGMAVAMRLLVFEGLRGGLLSLPAVLITLFLLVMAVWWASAAR